MGNKTRRGARKPGELDDAEIDFLRDALEHLADGAREYLAAGDALTFKSSGEFRRVVGILSEPGIHPPEAAVRARVALVDFRERLEGERRNGKKEEGPAEAGPSTSLPVKTAVSSGPKTGAAARRTSGAPARGT